MLLEEQSKFKISFPGPGVSGYPFQLNTLRPFPWAGSCEISQASLSVTDFAQRYRDRRSCPWAGRQATSSSSIAMVGLNSGPALRMLEVAPHVLPVALAS